MKISFLSKAVLGGVALSALMAGAAMADGALVYDGGGKFDKSFNEAAYTGAEKFKAEGGAYQDLEISGDAMREQAIRQFASRGNNPIVLPGFSWETALRAVAPEFPDTKFTIIDTEGVSSDGIVGGETLIDRICCIEAVAGLRTLPDACIPLTVTSPPYDGLRAFGGHDFGHETFERIARELWRVTLPGGVVAWVVADEIDGGYSGSSLRQALFFQSIGFRWAENLTAYPAFETERFVGYYRDTIEGAAVRLASGSVVSE